MPTLPTNRTTANTTTEHVDDHNILHGLNNQLGNFTQATAAPASPVAGDLWIDTDEAASSISDVRGELDNGYAQVTANQGTFTAVTDLTSLTVTVDVNSGEKIKITGYAGFSSSVANDRIDFWIYEGATPITRATCSSPSTTANNVFVTATVIARLTPSAGSHTYKLRGERGGGTGNVTMHAAATAPAFILVEGMGT